MIKFGTRVWTVETGGVVVGHPSEEEVLIHRPDFTRVVVKVAELLPVPVDRILPYTVAEYRLREVRVGDGTGIDYTNPSVDHTRP